MPDFTTDGCTGVFDGAWQACCIAHDYLYWWQPDGVSRGDADQMMAECISALGYNGVAGVMALGVGAFGWMFWNRGRRGVPGTEPLMLTRWIERFRKRKESDDANGLG